jgi:hypothetical protein
MANFLQALLRGDAAAAAPLMQVTAATDLLHLARLLIQPSTCCLLLLLLLLLLAADVLLCTGAHIAPSPLHHFDITLTPNEAPVSAAAAAGCQRVCSSSSSAPGPDHTTGQAS